MLKIGKTSSIDILIKALTDFLESCDEDDALVILGRATSTEIYKNSKTEDFDVYAEEPSDIFGDVLDECEEDLDEETHITLDEFI